MTTDNAILLDLTASQSSADYIAGRLRLPFLVIEAMLKRHQTAGLVTTKPISDGTVIVWFLTDKGKQHVQHLKRPTIKPRPIITAPITDH